MFPDYSSLERDLASAVKFFASDDRALAMPFMHAFPKNCCERCAALLAVALRRKYPSSRVEYVRGCDEKVGHLHFWVEIDGTILDPTANQFDGYSGALICPAPSPLELNFVRDKSVLKPEDETDLPENSNGQWHQVLSALCARIEA